MPTATSRTFMSGDDEVVRIPDELSFGPDVEVTLVRSGDVLTIVPTHVSNKKLIRRLSELPAPSSIEVRDEIEIPERHGL